MHDRDVEPDAGPPQAALGGTARPPFFGRDAELSRIRSLCHHARNGRGGSLLLLGEPGIGKTSVLQAATRDLRDVLLVEVRGYEAEMAMPFAAVQRLVRPLLSHVDLLPEQHRHALQVASGRTDGHPPDRFLVGLGVLGLLASAGEARPVVCAVDDAHLLDAESLDVLGFVGRRLEGESAVLLIAGRETTSIVSHVAGVPTMAVAGLPPTSRSDC
ncbi:ATP-binding protein [Aeromicrobium choanae]|uniref:AAA ATPase domain-containing protein n=1 Tax=Aeromicrobium choanae TaxID=1736691 RepID=A0A1T4Z7M5_9ACTN|nr:ATP-binding protein [Aeromicrobium choanae]SKB09868.1 AAA ATPase domain-containing protein [Aeromicrobium choanae]